MAPTEIITMRELDIPPQIRGDTKATEMIRVWLAHGELHVSLLLGMWQDAADSEIDERDAWGQLLCDLVSHIANGLEKSHGWYPEDTRRRIRAAFLDWLEDPQEVVGDYVPDDPPVQ